MRPAVSVRQPLSFDSYLLNQLTATLNFCMCMGHDHSSPGIRSQGHRPWASAHRGKWSQLTPPGKMDEKLKSENMQKKAVF